MAEAERLRQVLEAEGADRFRRLGAILEAVAEHGSLNRATAALGISYRQAWGLVRRVEQRLGAPLLTRRVGGAAGGGAELTELGRDLLTRCRWLLSEMDQVLTGPEPDPSRPILLASTIGPAEVGILDRLEAAFHGATGLWVRHIAAGSGQALTIARGGRVDLVLAHAPDEEEQFIAEGWGLSRHPLMKNDFVLVGPPEDPAGVRQAGSAAETMARIASAGALFLTRGDRSGTHCKELRLWEQAGVDPAGAPWYRTFERGAQGSGVTLREADRLGAYTLVDQATLAAVRPVRLTVLFERDGALENLFSLLALNPERLPYLNHTGARRFIAWATGPEGQAVIRESRGFVPVT